MNETFINKELLADEKSRKRLEHPFDRLSARQDAILKKYAKEPDVETFIWRACFCANELAQSKELSRYSLFVTNIESLWDSYFYLPDDLKDAFKAYGKAVERMGIHTYIFDESVRVIDEVISYYVETKDSNCHFIQGVLDMFDVIDATYHPGANNAMTEAERRFILEKTCDAYRPLLQEIDSFRRRGITPPLRDCIAQEVFRMIRDWGDDEYADKFENYPIGPDIEVEDIMADVTRVTSGGLFTPEEQNAYKHLKMRDLYELIEVYLNYREDGIKEAQRLYGYFGQLVRELGDDIKESYFSRYMEAGKMIRKELKRIKTPKHGKR